MKGSFGKKTLVFLVKNNIARIVLSNNLFHQKHSFINIIFLDCYWKQVWPCDSKLRNKMERNSRFKAQKTEKSRWQVINHEGKENKSCSNEKNWLMQYMKVILIKLLKTCLIKKYTFWYCSVLFVDDEVSIPSQDMWVVWIEV